MFGDGGRQGFGLEPLGARLWSARNPRALFAIEEKDKKRPLTELQYRIAPYLKPYLGDQLSTVKNARSTKSMEWAEARLRQVGFALEREGKVKTWTRVAGSVVAFADPRLAGSISFIALRRPFPREYSFVLEPPVPTAGFVLDDRRVKDIEKLVDELFSSAVAGLPPLRLV